MNDTVLNQYITGSLERTYDLFGPYPQLDQLKAKEAKMAYKMGKVETPLDSKKLEWKEVGDVAAMTVSPDSQATQAIHQLQSSQQLTTYQPPPQTKQSQQELPEWHAPWKMYKAIPGHGGWVRAVAVDPSNEWFATGSADKTVRIWDLATAQLKLTLTGHIATVRGLAISNRHPYLFSASEDKTMRCWDLESNKVIRNYYGHMSAVYTVDLHPTLDILVTGGRDSTVRVWDMRTKAAIYVFSTHDDSVFSVKAQSAEPQFISGSGDKTVRLWDLIAGREHSILTNHKTAVRSVCIHDKEYAFASASTDNIKKWALPDGYFANNFAGHKAVINSLALAGNVMVSCADNGSLYFWDWKTQYCFQKTETIAHPGSLASEQGIFAATFDHSHSRLITCEADKTIKIWKEDAEATPLTHPITDYHPSKNKDKF